jgi:PAS domain S-box-containing protein
MPAERSVNDRDIIQRKQAEQALRDSEHRFRDYAETAFDWFWEMGPDLRFTNLSHQAPYRASVIGATRWDVAADADEEPEKWHVHRAILDAREPFRDFTYKTVRPDGSTMWVSVSGKPVFDEQGGFLGYRGAAKDVSDRVRADEAERSLQETRMELARVARVTTLGVLTASIAHEIQQPLTAVVTNAAAGLRWLSREPPNLAEAQETLARIARDGQRASDVIDRVRAFGRRAPVKMGRVCLNDAIREVIALTRDEITRSRVALNLKLGEPAPLILGDQVQLQQVILNLMLNAVEAMGDGEPRELSIESRADGGARLVVSVSDSGSGLDPAKVDQVFQAFYSTKPGGTGMGLSICRSIIEAHQGKIWARADLPRGSTFEFALPVAAEPAAAAQSSGPPLGS